MSARRRFDEELGLLHHELVEMGSMIEKAIKTSFKAIESDDEEAAKDIIESDKAINEMERKIEARCLKLILRQQPVATDLRLISTAMKMITDMERIGDHAADIASICLDDEKEKNPEPFRIVDDKILKMADIDLEMVASSISAFINDNLELAKTTIKTDSEVDELFYEVRDDIIKGLKSDKISPSLAMDTLMLIKYLERIGDHATNICEWVIFYLTGEHKNKKLL
ncbi:phosphate signaling complex protein PhoU [Anaerofustis stercorihominis]|uniref:Phosphate-specific transport system accessory protein PhoU n=2 Tax=Anaerofustis stercorihominis TaxID=214853 RepID=B1C9A3_9FIRM|nr:phosphate signaling complex protein PhoU [Anaerofustis stercorihominis]EDS72267.1 phosphate transport system regulatory protein PhoU [Anaerofustis stercorihominis DSM 17244]RGD73192.1 phosphate transport system regulatory protein PhoU [Anaerofustis stercorihominis]